MRIVTLLFILLAGAAANAQAGATAKPVTIGETLSFYSEALQETRELNIYLPAGYAGSTETYPVIYLLDGGMDEDFLHIAGLVQFASFEWLQKAPRSIVVGIANTDRKRDFTYPTKNKKDKKDLPTSGGSEAFINFIENELQPLVAQKYRTAPSKTIIGQSLGGLLATEILFHRPHLFNNYIIVSPSLWWDDESLLRETPAASAARHVFIAVGKEGTIMENDAQALAGKLQAKHAVQFRLYEQYNHGDLLHFAVYDALGFCNQKP